jgi:hypothetical protein
MHKGRISLLVLAVALCAMPLAASQFLDIPFDQMVRGTTAVVRGTIGPVSASWDADHEVIFSYARVDVSDYIAGDGPAVLMLREVGGTVDGYTQQAIGFPSLREGEDVVLLLTVWEDSGEYRIQGFHRGKYLVRDRNGRAMMRLDRETQGTGRDDAAAKTAADDEVSIDEFRTQVGAVMRGRAGGAMVRE